MRINWYKVFEASAAAEPARVVVREGERSVTFAADGGGDDVCRNKD